MCAVLTQWVNRRENFAFLLSRAYRTLYRGRPFGFLSSTSMTTDVNEFNWSGRVMLNVRPWVLISSWSNSRTRWFLSSNASSSMTGTCQFSSSDECLRLRPQDAALSNRYGWPGHSREDRPDVEDDDAEDGDETGIGDGVLVATRNEPGEELWGPQEREADPHKPNGTRDPRHTEAVLAHGTQKGRVGRLECRGHLNPASGCDDPYDREHQETGHQ